MIEAVTFLLLAQLAGEAIVRALGLPVPGPVVGLVLLACDPGLRAAPSPALSDTAHGLLRNLSLLFVPAGVGIMRQADAIAGNWLALSLGLIVSTVATLAVTALVFQWAQRRFGGARRRRRQRHEQRPPASGSICRPRPLLWLTLTLAAYAIADSHRPGVQAASAGQSGDHCRGAGDRRAGDIEDALRYLFRGRPVRALPARPGDGGAGHPAGRELGTGETLGGADPHRACRRLADRHRHRRRHRRASRRAAADPRLDRREVGDHADRHGHRGEDRRHPVADRGAGDPDRRASARSW